MTTKNFVVKNGITTGNIVLEASTGNITGVGNANLGNLAIANFFSGNGNALFNIQAANIVGTAGNANFSAYAGTVTNNAQPNITSVGTLTSLAVTGNISAGNISTGGVLSVTGNANVGNIGAAAGVFTGNVSAGNISTTGLLNATGNANVGNLGTAALVATGTGSFGGNVNMNSKNINNLADPVGDQDAATKLYVDNIAQGLDPKASVNYATAAALPAYTYNNGTSGVGATITGSSNGALSVDGSAVSAGQRILVKNETSTNAPYNGIYVVTNAGSGGAAYVLTRATDFNAPAEVPSAFTFVEEGSTLADTGWVCTTGAPVTIGTTDITFVQFSGAGSYTAGTGLTLTGTTFSVNTAQPTITSVGTLTSLNVSGNANVGNIGGAAGVFTGNVSGGNLTTGGALSVTGNANVGALTVSGTSNLNAIGNVTITGGSNGQVIQTDGAGNLSFVTISTSSISNGNSNVSIPSANGNVNISAVGNANIVVITGTGANITGTLNASGNANVGNLGTAGLITATGNVTGGNLTTGGALSVTGNANVGNIGATSAVFTGSLGVTGNANVGNLGTAGLIVATGNVTGGNLTTGGALSVTGNANVGNIGAAAGVFTTVAGSLTTAAQPNITSVGTLTSVAVTGNATVGNVVLNGGLQSNRTNVSATTNTVLDQFSPSTYRTAKYIISASSANGYQSVETLLVQDGTNAYITIYGSVCSNVAADIIDVTANINGVSGNVTLYATSSGGTATVNLLATYLQT